MGTTLFTVYNCFYRASESDGPSRSGSAGTPHLGHLEARPTPPGSSGMVASLLSFCAPPCIVTGGARATARARWQAGGTTLSAAYTSSGSGENYSTVDSAGSALLSLAASAMLHNVSVNEARRRPRNGSGRLGEEASRGACSLTGCSGLPE